MFFQIKHNTRPIVAQSINLLNLFKYRILRPVVSFFAFWFYCCFFYKKFEKTFSGEKLKKGISVYVPVKNEESWITPCLESLVGVADQFIVIDNGSTDQTWSLIQEFKKQHESVIEIIAIQRPGALLVEIVQEALSFVNREWVLKWDSDLIASKERFIALKETLDKYFQPRAFILPYFNFFGDENHIRKGANPVMQGEPSLRRFNNKLVFKEEYGRLEHARLPIYYQLVFKSKKLPFSFHFSGVRPPLRFLERTIYLDWREVRNNFPQKADFEDIQIFREKWLIHNFNANEINSVKFRAGRLIATMAEKTTSKGSLGNNIIEFPVNLPQRFSIKYADGRPYLMVDLYDKEMEAYSPSQEDNNWFLSPDDYYNDKRRMAFIHEEN